MDDGYKGQAAEGDSKIATGDARRGQWTERKGCSAVETH